MHILAHMITSSRSLFVVHAVPCSVPGSVLWLLRFPAEGEARVRAYVEAEGIPATRLVFSAVRALPAVQATHMQYCCDVYTLSLLVASRWWRRSSTLQEGAQQTCSWIHRFAMHIQRYLVAATPLTGTPALTSLEQPTRAPMHCGEARPSLRCLARHWRHGLAHRCCTPWMLLMT